MAATPLVRPDDKLYAEDSIASIDMSDLNAIKSDNEGEVDEEASRAFPRFPPFPHSQPQSPIDSPRSAPAYVHTPRKPSKSSIHSIHVSSISEEVDMRDRAMSPEITHIISATPRPRKRSTPSRSRDSSSTRNRKDSSKGGRGAEVPPLPTGFQRVKTPARSSGEDEVICVAREDEGNDSDSSLDLHTPLPWVSDSKHILGFPAKNGFFSSQLMLRHGMLSPNSKLLPQLEADPMRLSILSSSSYLSNASNISLMSTTSTCSKHPKDARDTPQRRVRHRDGKLLKGGIGLTTGLGWSDRSVSSFFLGCVVLAERLTSVVEERKETDGARLGRVSLICCVFHPPTTGAVTSVVG